MISLNKDEDICKRDSSLYQHI